MVLGQAKDPKRIKAILEASIDRALLKSPPAGKSFQGSVGFVVR
jgi:hypothetical protein